LLTARYIGGKLIWDWKNVVEVNTLKEVLTCRESNTGIGDFHSVLK
jgi:hypothetical protein